MAVLSGDAVATAARWVGIDIGTSSLKVAAFDAEMNCLAIVRRAYATSYSTEGAAEQNPADWWSACLSGLTELGRRAPLRRVRALGLSGFNALVGVTAAGAACGPAITYLDRRPGQIQRALADKIAPEFVLARAANRFTAGGMWAVTLNYIRSAHPTYWDRADHFLAPAGYIGRILTGRSAVDSSRASLTLLHDPTTATPIWDAELCAAFAIAPAKLPPILNPWDLLGGLLSDVLPSDCPPAGIPVIVGGMDSCSAALAAAVLDPTVLFDIGGSAGGLLIAGDCPRPDQRLLTVRHLVPRRWLSIGPLSAAGNAWQWFRDQLLGGRFTDEELLQRAAAAPIGSGGLHFLPYLAGARSPQWDENADARFGGLRLHHDVGHMARAVLEGVAFAQRDVLTVLRDCDYAPQIVRSAGGQAGNQFWLQMKADVLGLPHSTAVIEEASVRGAALLAAAHCSDTAPTPVPIGTNVLHPQRSCVPEYESAYARWGAARAGVFRET